MFYWMIISFGISTCSGDWYPHVEQSDLRAENLIFRLYDSTSFSTLNLQLTNVLNDYVTKLNLFGYNSISENFQWVTSTGFNEFDSNSESRAWTFIAGTIPYNQNRSTNNSNVKAFSKEAIALIGCELLSKKKELNDLQINKCYSIDMNAIPLQHKLNKTSGFAALTVASLKFEQPYHGAMLIYCDPLWFTDNNNNNFISGQNRINLLNGTKNPIKPSGKCRIRVRQSGDWIKLRHDTTKIEDEITFCVNTDYSQPCAGGYTIDLQQYNMNNGRTDSNALPNIRLLVGLPYAQPYGEVRVYDDILYKFKKDIAHSNHSIITRIIGHQSNFGHKVLWAPKRKSQSSYIQHSKSNERTVEGSLLIASPSTSVSAKVTGYQINGQKLFHLGPINYKKSTDQTKRTNTEFSGFGLSMETIYFPFKNLNSAIYMPYAVLIGAPYASHEILGKNVGKVYISCPSRDLHVSHNMTFITGHRPNELFGYAIKRLGDLNGDGIDEVAIGAPAIHYHKKGNETYDIGRVYIYRLTEECTLDPKPIQIFESPNYGFGVDLTRGFDADQDGWPELMITSLEAGKAPSFYSMPKLLRAQCQFSVPPSLMVRTNFPKYFKIPITLIVRLFDLNLKQFVNIPEGISSNVTRIHQVNPDALWMDKLSQSQEISEFFQSIINNNINMSTLRFNYDMDSLSIRTTSNNMIIKFDLISLYSSELINLVSVPLKIAYRSLINLNECSPTYMDFSSQNHLCTKFHQPYVDWSGCEGIVKLSQYICVPEPSCKSDIAVIDVNDDEKSSEYKKLKNGTSYKQLEYGNANHQRQMLQFQVINLGPTKATGIHLELRVKNTFNSNTSIYSEIANCKNFINLQISNIIIKKLNKSDTHKDNELNKNSWSKKVAENGFIALIYTEPNTWIYPNEGLVLNVALFVDHLVEKSVLDPGCPTSYSEAPQESLPFLELDVISSTFDENTDNNRLNVIFPLVYKPRLDISAWMQPPSIIDERTEPMGFEKDVTIRKVFSSDIGPKLEHIFLIENRGSPTLNNLVFMLQLPVETTYKKRLLYVTDQTRQRSADERTISWTNSLPQFISLDGQERGRCEVPSEYINPLDLTVLDFKIHDQSEATIQSDASGARKKKRSTESDHNTHYLRNTKSNFETNSILPPYKANKQLKQRGRIIIKCANITSHSNPPSQTFEDQYFLKNFKCAQIICTLKKLEKFDAVRLRWTGWLWSDTIFELNMPDVQFISQLTLINWGNIPIRLSNYGATNQQPNNGQLVYYNHFNYPPKNPQIEIKQSIIYRNVPVEKIHQVPWWPIIAGIVVGSILLFILGASLYCCGFFQRSRIKYQKITVENNDTSAANKKSHSQNNGNTKSRYLGSDNRLLDCNEFFEQSPNLLRAQEPEPPSPRAGNVQLSDYEIEKSWLGPVVTEYIISDDTSHNCANGHDARNSAKIFSVLNEQEESNKLKTPKCNYVINESDDELYITNKRKHDVEKQELIE